MSVEYQSQYRKSGNRGTKRKLFRLISFNLYDIPNVKFCVPIVLDVPYEAEVQDARVIPGNVAVLTCAIPSYVSDYVTVTSWIRDDLFNIFASLRGGETFRLDRSNYFNLMKKFYLAYFKRIIDSRWKFSISIYHKLNWKNIKYRTLSQSVFVG